MHLDKGRYSGSIPAPARRHSHRCNTLGHSVMCTKCQQAAAGLPNGLKQYYCVSVLAPGPLNKVDAAYVSHGQGWAPLRTKKRRGKEGCAQNRINTHVGRLKVQHPAQQQLRKTPGGDKGYLAAAKTSAPRHRQQLGPTSRH